MTAPKDESVSLVKTWLQNEMPSGKISMTGDYITVEGTVDAIEKLLNTKYSSYSKSMTFLVLCIRMSADIH
jgi:tripeptidyl-peptidase-1